MTSRLRLVALFLFGSLAVNLFLGGIMVGRWLEPHPPGRHHPPPGERPPREPGAPPSWLQRAVGPEGARALDETWSRHAPAIEPLRDELWRSREAVTSALEAEPFDPAAYAAALGDMQARTLRLYEATNAAMLDVAASLTPEQRRMLVEQSREWQRRRSGRD